jgi:hypothetical protein
LSQSQLSLLKKACGQQSLLQCSTQTPADVPTADAQFKIVWKLYASEVFHTPAKTINNATQRHLVPANFLGEIGGVFKYSLNFVSLPIKSLAVRVNPGKLRHSDFLIISGHANGQVAQNFELARFAFFRRHWRQLVFAAVFNCATAAEMGDCPPIYN